MTKAFLKDLLKKKYFLICILQQNWNFEKFQVFFEKIRYFFLQKWQILNILRILTFPVVFHSKIAANWWKQNFRREQYADVGVNEISKHRVKKKRRKWPIWVEEFAFIFLTIWPKITTRAATTGRFSLSNFVEDAF